jgi:hypothetical protein
MRTRLAASKTTNWFWIRRVKQTDAVPAGAGGISGPGDHQFGITSRTGITCIETFVGSGATFKAGVS